MEHLGLVGFTGAGANRLFAALTGLDAPSEYEAAVGVATVPGSSFFRPGAADGKRYTRFAFCKTQHTLERAVEKLAKLSTAGA